jgi:hypothetical protein
VDGAGPGDEILVATGIYTDIHMREGITQVVYISRTVTIRGGYSGDFGARDPVMFPTTLDAGSQGRVVTIVGAGITPTIDGLMIIGGDATGLTTHCPPAGGASQGCGGGILVYQAAPVIVGNVISGNVAGLSTGPNSASGGGVCLHYAQGTVITGNLILGNVASPGARGYGGGMHLHYPYDVLVSQNRVIGNLATAHPSLAGWGGGIAISGSGAAAKIVGNWIEGNQTNSGNTGYGAGIYNWYGSSDLIGNQVSGNRGTHAVYLGRYEGGYFEANRVVSNATTVGVELVNGTAQGVLLVNNVVARSGADSVRAQTVAAAPLSATLRHNTIVGSGPGRGVVADTAYVTIRLANNIVAGHIWGITNTVPASSTIVADHTLFSANAQDGIAGTNPLHGNPAFVDAGSGDYHVRRGSAAIDAAVEVGVNSDQDGDPRPIGGAPDIGADEAWLFTGLPLVLRGS